MKLVSTEYTGPDWEAYCRIVGSKTTGAPAYSFRYKSNDYYVVWTSSSFSVITPDGDEVGTGETRTKAIEDAKFWINHPI